MSVYVDRTIEQKKASPADHPVGFDPSDDDSPLFAATRKVYPQSVKGGFRTIKWVVLLVTLGIYYGLPFIRWNRGPGAPGQAVLLDLSHSRFYFFFIEIWPQEVYYVTGLLILAAVILFLMNAIAGRVWCGYLCPQTVWTDLFFAIERFTEGDRREHMQRDAGPWTAERIVRKAAKHVIWLVIAWWTGGAWVLYFADAPTLVKDLATGNADFIAYACIGLLTTTTYLLAGHLREQVCVYMCPWPRIQAALTDEFALNVTYRHDRGEPRASIKKSALLRQQNEPAGDCIDCRQCVNVCPTGIDIRNGPNLGCIQCGLCIDACDTVMTKVGRPLRLIAYDTEMNVGRRQEGKEPLIRIVRTRTALYAGIIALVGSIMLYALATRHDLGLNVIHDRNPAYVRLADGSLRNGYTIRILNKRLQAREFIIATQGLSGSIVDVVGVPLRADGRLVVDVGPDQTREIRALVTDYGAAPPASTPLIFFAIDAETGERAQAPDYFHGP